MAVLSGAHFKKTNTGPWFKWLRKDMTHHGYSYAPGLNVDSIKFNPTGRCKPGGLYFMMSIKYLPEFYSYGPVLGIFDIPDDAQVYIADESDNEFKCNKVILIETVSSDIDLVDYFRKAKENIPLWKYRICMDAARNGHLEVLKWARENGCPWSFWTFRFAALNGHLEVLKWLKENGCPWDSMPLLAHIETDGRLDALKWLQEVLMHN